MLPRRLEDVVVLESTGVRDGLSPLPSEHFKRTLYFPVLNAICLLSSSKGLLCLGPISENILAMPTDSIRSNTKSVILIMLFDF